MLAGISGVLGFVVALVIWDLWKERERSIRFKEAKREAERLEKERIQWISMKTTKQTE